jgi:hypothetical protein
MKVHSAVGEFNFDITGIELKPQGVVLVGTMGVWEARTLMQPSDLRRLTGMLLKQPGLMRYLIRQLFSSNRKGEKR